MKLLIARLLIFTLTLLISGYALWQLNEWQKVTPLPSINGTLIATPIQLPRFNLLDHNRQEFSNEQLLGRWQIITYGYTHCPDVCPATLMNMVQLEHRLIEKSQQQDYQILFYTVDPNRDTDQVLQRYIRYFSPNFTALLATNQQQQQIFEEGLGIKAEVTLPEKKEDVYKVSHGLSIFVVNPSGHLQAVLQPQVTELGFSELTVEQLEADLDTIKRFYQSLKIKKPA